jgi:transcription antitermination factor NusG
MTLHWYALRAKPRKEDVIWRQARLQGFEVFYPRVRVHPVNPRSRKVLPYFPGYLFVQADLEAAGTTAFQWMPHTLGLVSFGGEAATVPDNLIAELRKRIQEIAESGGEIFDGLQTGDVVIISDGPFRGFEAIFDARLPGNARVRVLLEFLNNRRRVPLELDTGKIQRIRNPRKSPRGR